jgi:hypothetical protein
MSESATLRQEVGRVHQDNQHLVAVLERYTDLPSDSEEAAHSDSPTADLPGASAHADASGNSGSQVRVQCSAGAHGAALGRGAAVGEAALRTCRWHPSMHANRLACTASQEAVSPAALGVPRGGGGGGGGVCNGGDGGASRLRRQLRQADVRIAILEERCMELQRVCA